MNFFNIVAKANKTHLVAKFDNGEELKFDLKKMRKVEEKYLDGQEHKLTLGVRAEHLSLAEKGLSTKLSIYEILGSVVHLFVHLDGFDKDYIVSVDDRKNFISGQPIHLKFDESKIHLFDGETGNSILSRENNHD